MVMVLIAGVASLRAIPVESDPSIAVPVYVINVFNEGISSEDAERLLVLPLENELRSVERVEEIEGYASENSATIVVQFDVSIDIEQAATDVREAVDRARVELPSTA